METAIYPWRRHRDIREALAAERQTLVSLGIVHASSGYRESEIAMAERRLGEPLPSEVREFFRSVRPYGIFEPNSTRDFGFYPLNSKELLWQAMDEAEPADQWASVRGLTLGQSLYGDAFWWIKGHRSLPTGSIVLLDHDGALGGDVMFVYFARSLTEFIAKVAHFKGLYALPHDPLFEREYRELNGSPQV